LRSVNHQTLARKLEYLRRHLRLLDTYQKTSAEALIASPEKRLAVERLLELSLQSMIDCGRMLVAIERWRLPHDQRDALMVLASHSVIDAGLADRLQQAKAFRNILVHDYVEIDIYRLVEHLQEDLGDLWAFARGTAEWLQAHPPDIEE
jgi:uncharacterized protein YutE (UPF0331/DUF86 family)